MSHGGGAVLAEIQGVDAGLLVTAFVLGLRHGIDWDHVAAIGDLAANQSKPRYVLKLASI
jgi:high-affinity nickel permease